MKQRHVFSLAVVLMIALFFCAACMAESYDASAMRLLRYTGTAEIFDITGNPRAVTENALLSSGETLVTGPESTASVSLGDGRTVYLDAGTKVEFIREGGQMKMNLAAGTLLLDVQGRLDENESLDIQTTAMAAGIRGTIAAMSSIIDRETNTETTVLNMLEGKAEIRFEDGNGTRRSVSVPEGQAAKIGTGENGEPVGSMKKLEPADLTEFVLHEILNNPEMQERLAGLLNRMDEGTEGGADEDGEYEYPADGDWSYPGTVLLAAPSAGKLYDGRELSCPYGVLVYGLPADFTAEVSSSGTQTDAGSSTNTVSAYTIRNRNHEDITSHFNIETVDGTLTVQKLPVTVWTGSAEKVYDGTPLTCDAAGIRAVPAENPDMPQWRNSSVSGTTAAGSSVICATSGVIRLCAANPFTGMTDSITLRAGEMLTVTVNDADSREMIYTAVKLGVSELPEVVLRLYGDNPALLRQACEDAGWDEKELEAAIAARGIGEHETVSRSGLEVAAGDEDRLIVDRADVHITVDTAGVRYNGRPLDAREVQYVPVKLPETITVTATGSRTEVGESVNAYRIDWGDEDPENYVITEEPGKLTVTEPYSGVTVTAASAAKTYDGRPLTANGFTVRGLPDGMTLRAGTSGSRTDAGSGTNRISRYRILDAEGKDVTASFASVRLIDGTLTVSPAPLTVTTGSAQKQYDGTPLTQDEVSVSGLIPGETATVTATGTITAVGTAENTCAIAWGTAKESNYIIKESLGTLEVIANDTAITFTAGSGTKIYDGTALTAGEVTAEGLPEGFTYTAAATGSQTDAGESDSTVTSYAILKDGEDVTANFSGVETAKGTLRVTKAPLKIGVTGSISDYTGYYYGADSDSPYINPTYTDCGGVRENGVQVNGGVYEHTLFTGDTLCTTAEGGGTDPGTYDLNVVSWTFTSGSADNYEVTLISSTVSIKNPFDDVITITSGDAEKDYDGTPLTCGDVTVTGLSNEFSWMKSDPDDSRTDAGESDNTVPVQIINMVGQDVTNRFTNVITVPGTLKVNPAKISVTSPNVTKAYDGQPLPESTDPPPISGVLYDEGIYTACTASTIIDAGEETDNSFEIVWDGANPDNYEVESTVGKLKITALKLRISLGGRTVTYNGTPATISGVKMTILDGDHAGETLTPSSASYNTSNCEVNFELFTGDTVRVTVNGYGEKDAGKYELEAKWSVTGIRTNYDVTYSDTELIVEPARISVTSPSVTREYDGQPLPESTDPPPISGDYVDECIYTVSTASTIIDAGEETDNSFEIVWNGANKKNYDVETEVGRLEIIPRIVVIDCGGDLVEYIDGSILVMNNPSGIQGVDSTSISRGSDTVTAVFSLVGGGKITLVTKGVYGPEEENIVVSAVLEGKESNYDITYLYTSVSFF